MGTEGASMEDIKAVVGVGDSANKTRRRRTRAANPRMEGPDHDQRLSRECPFGDSFLHHHSQAQSDGQLRSRDARIWVSRDSLFALIAILSLIVVVLKFEGLPALGVGCVGLMGCWLSREWYV
uniref:Uncharacterized protein n=1 Tax=Fagus sylvatica TaxID=28930 RepID=A0A2N9EK82_FAGSY